MESTSASARPHGAGRAGERASAAADRVESATSAVSWPAIIAGAFIAAAATLVLVALGSGLGLASVSPWRDTGASATTFTIMTGIWLIIVQWVASGLGGYMTGRLRTKWVGTHSHEVFFRDTAHGFLTWAVATVIGAALLAVSALSTAEAGLHAAGTAAGGAAQGAVNAAATQASGYRVDALLRSSKPDANASSADTRAEVTRILATGLQNGDVPAADRTYLATLVATRTGISQDEAQKRVDDTINQAKAAEAKAREAADAARKAASAVSIFTALSMLIGAFIACVAASLGGRLRDEHP